MEKPVIDNDQLGASSITPNKIPKPPMKKSNFWDPPPPPKKSQISK
jgi:hypothetical protein